MPKKALPPLRRIALIASGVFFAALAVALLDTVIDIWPSVGVQHELCKKAESMPLDEREAFIDSVREGSNIRCRFKDIPIARVNLGGKHTFLSPDQGMIGLVVLLALLGALIRSLRAVVWAGAGLGEGQGETSIAWNLVRPVAAALLAITVYFALRALFLPGGRIVDVNPYGFLAVAAATGLLCDELLCWAIARGRSLLGPGKTAKK